MSSPLTSKRRDGGDPLPPGVRAASVQICAGGLLQAAGDVVAEEVPVALVYNGEPHAVMMATPADLEDFAYGFSCSEGIVGEVAELEHLRLRRLAGDEADAGIELALLIPEARAASLMARRRSLQGRSGCGLCGAQTIEAAMRPVSRVPMGVGIGASAVRRALDAVRAQQSLNALTGGVHAAAWCSTDGLVIALREDVGRHNALDKLIGHGLRSGLDFARGFLVMTSRASYEIVHKAASVGIPFMVAMSAPTAHAIQLADQAGMTLIAFARPERQVIYTHAGRLISGELHSGARP